MIQISSYISESIDLLKADAKGKLKLLNSWFVANKQSLSLDKTCYSIMEQQILKNLKYT